MKYVMKSHFDTQNNLLVNIFYGSYENVSRILKAFIKSV